MLEEYASYSEVERLNLLPFSGKPPSAFEVIEAGARNEHQNWHNATAS